MKRLSLFLGLVVAGVCIWLFWPRTAEPASAPGLPEPAAAAEPSVGSLERGAVAAPEVREEPGLAAQPSMPAAFGWTIRVEDLAAVPLAGALVWLADERGVARAQGRTAADGRLVVAPQEWAAMAGARLEGFAPEQVAFRSRSPGTEVLLRMTPATRISGTVFDWQHRPVDGVRILATPDGQPVTADAVLAVLQTAPELVGPFTLAISAEDGSFSIASPCPGRLVRMSAGGAGYAAETWQRGVLLEDFEVVGIEVKRIYGARWQLAAPGIAESAEAGAVAALRLDVPLKLSWNGIYSEEPMKQLDASLILAGALPNLAPSDEAPIFIQYTLAGKKDSQIQGLSLEFGLPGRSAQTISLPLYPLPDGIPPLRLIPLGEEKSARGEVEVGWIGPAHFFGAPTQRPLPGWAWLEFEPVDDAARTGAGGSLQAAVGGFPLMPVRVTGIPHGMYQVRFKTLYKFSAPSPEAAVVRVVVGAQPAAVQLDLSGMSCLRIEPFLEDGLPYTGPASLMVDYRFQQVPAGPYLVPGLPSGRVWSAFTPWHSNQGIAGWADLVAGATSTWQVRVPLPPEPK